MPAGIVIMSLRAILIITLYSFKTIGGENFLFCVACNVLIC